MVTGCPYTIIDKQETKGSSSVPSVRHSVLFCAMNRKGEKPEGKDTEKVGNYKRT